MVISFRSQGFNVLDDRCIDDTILAVPGDEEMAGK
jgi:hypothetical protein